MKEIVKERLDQINKTIDQSANQNAILKELYKVLINFTLYNKTYNKEFYKRLNRTEYRFVSNLIRSGSPFCVWLQNPFEEAEVNFIKDNGVYKFSVNSSSVKKWDLTTRQFYKFLRHEGSLQ